VVNLKSSFWSSESDAVKCANASLKVVSILLSKRGDNNVVRITQIVIGIEPGKPWKGVKGCSDVQELRNLRNSKSCPGLTIKPQGKKLC
jgi:hypothetical protein